MSRPKLLVVEDKESMLRVLERILSPTYTVATASDGASALALLRREAFDLVLSDVRMPGADGFEVLRAVRQLAPGTTQVVLMTAFAEVPRAVQAIKEGAYDYLAKPFEPDDLLLIVSRALAAGRAAQAPGDAATGASCAPPTEAPATEATGSPHAGGAAAPEALLSRPFRQVVDQARDAASREYLSALLHQFGGNVTRAAEHAGMERESLHRLLKRYELKSDDFKRS